MFHGTTDSRYPGKKVLIETHYLEKLDCSYVCKECFNIIILKSGSLLTKIQSIDCFFTAPAVICLDNLKSLEIISDNGAEAEIINFDPSFLNVNMQISTIRSVNYEHLCQLHSFFQLSPFLTDDIDKIGFQLSEDTLDKVERAFHSVMKNITEQKDWYWSCRARSYFIDIINVLERMYFNDFIEAPVGSCIKVKIPSEFKDLISYINNHLEQKHTLESLYQHFRINKNLIESLFKQYLNTTFGKYLKMQRFETASYYLRFTELDGEQIAARIGLSSSQNFCKFFKQMSGMSPNCFRKQAVLNRKKIQLNEIQ